MDFNEIRRSETSNSILMVMNFYKAIALKKARQINLVNGMKGLVNGVSLSCRKEIREGVARFQTVQRFLNAISLPYLIRIIAQR